MAKEFCFYFVFKAIFLGTAKFRGAHKCRGALSSYAPVATGLTQCIHLHQRDTVINIPDKFQHIILYDWFGRN